MVQGPCDVQLSRQHIKNIRFSINSCVWLFWCFVCIFAAQVYAITCLKCRVKGEDMVQSVVGGSQSFRGILLGVNITRKWAGINLQSLMRKWYVREYSKRGLFLGLRLGLRISRDHHSGCKSCRKFYTITAKRIIA